MKTVTYSITINAPREVVYDRIFDKAYYATWVKPWGPDMTYEGKWDIGEHVSFFDHKQGGSKAIVEDIMENEYIKLKHVAMVDPANQEIELTDDIMKKWIGSLEQYFFKKNSDNQMTLDVVFEFDEAFQQMFDDACPKSLELLKDICEK